MRKAFTFLYTVLLCGTALAVQAATPNANAAQETAANAADATSGTLVSFAPTDGARFERLLTSQSSTAINGDAVSTHTIRTQVQEHWEKSGNQWLLHCTPTDVNTGDNNNPMTMIDQVFLNQPYTVVFDTSGKVVEVRGFDDISQKLEEVLSSGTLSPNVSKQLIANFTPQSMRANVALSQNYRLNWLYGKHWQAGAHYKEQKMPPSVASDRQITIETAYTVSAIDAKVLILSLQADGKIAASTVSEKGTITLDTATGQLQQLERTRLIENRNPDTTANTAALKSTEVLTISWTRAD